MLVLSLKPGVPVEDEMVIEVGDDQIVIKLIETKGKWVRVGVTAPKKYPVHRQKVMGKIAAGRHAKGCTDDESSPPCMDIGNC